MPVKPNDIHRSQAEGMSGLFCRPPCHLLILSLTFSMSHKNFPPFPFLKIFTFFHSPARKSNLLHRYQNDSKGQQHLGRGDKPRANVYLRQTLSWLCSSPAHTQSTLKRAGFSRRDAKHFTYISRFQLCLCQEITGTGTKPNCKQLELTWLQSNHT